MSWLRKILLAAAFLAVAGVIVSAVATRKVWLGWFSSPASAANDEHEEHDDHIELSPQAMRSIGLRLEPIRLETFERKLRIPARIVAQPGRSKRIVSTHILGVIEKIYAYPGQVIRPGDKLFKLHLVSDHLQEAQDELHRTFSELKINSEEQQRLEGLAKMGAISEKLMLDLTYQQRKLQATERALRHKLNAHGLPSQSIDEIAKGKFIKNWTIYASSPDKAEHGQPTKSPPASSSAKSQEKHLYELGKLNVTVGSQVQPGAALCTLLLLADLYVEGQVFGNEVNLIEQAILKRSEVEVEVVGDDKYWSEDASSPRVRLRFLSHQADAGNQTVSVYGQLKNPSHSYEDKGIEYRLWRYRTGQRAYLLIPIETLTDVFVLPSDAVVRDGPSSFVFRKIGKNLLEPVEVQVRYQDRKDVVIAKDNVKEGEVIAQNAVAQLYRELLSESQQGHGHHHHHD